MSLEAIYIHVPWCRRRCPYCDFYFVVGKPSDKYITAIIREFDERSPSWLKSQAQSLYFGGGTPSMLAPQKLGVLIDHFRTKKALSLDAEITLEANPEDLNEAMLCELKSAGINRLSIGVQSLSDQILKKLGRKHRREQALQAIEFAQKAGFSNISTDFIIGVPGENSEELRSSLTKLHELGIAHISAYLLTIEEKTAFKKRIDQGLSPPLIEDEQIQSYRLVQNSLKSMGYVQYEISSYGKPGFFSRHNQLYWAKGSYLGLGPGAHSMKILPDGATERRSNKASLELWQLMPEATLGDGELLEPKKALLEALAFGLRDMHLGIDIESLCRRHRQERPAGLEAALKKMCDFGWLAQFEQRYCITEHGALFADAIMAEILSC